jgi:hypothetical protein
MVKRSRLSGKLYIRPRLAFCYAGGAGYPRLSPSRTYLAQIASNQPEFKKLGLVFVDFGGKDVGHSILLSKKDYEIVKKKVGD